MVKPHNDRIHVVFSISAVSALLKMDCELYTIRLPLLQATAYQHNVPVSPVSKPQCSNSKFLADMKIPVVHLHKPCSAWFFEAKP